jgi:hypothetical protein
MKKIAFLTVLTMLVPALLLAQGHRKKGNITYTFGYNEVPENCNIPLIGFVNMAHGDQKSLHVGFVNTTEDNMGGAQIGFINTVGNDMEGIQISFVNTTGDNLLGFQCAFINTVGNRFTGIQTGFINTIGDNGSIIQAGFINTIGDKMSGTQVGFINTVGSRVQGAQIGFVNSVERMEGLQVGFINGVGRLKGLQIGFVNSAESVDEGVPIGFLSFVKHGGYQASEFSFNEMYPYNISYKLGVDKFYTFPMVSYNPNLAEPWAIGFGAGSIVPMNEEVFFNPELSSQTVLSGDYKQLTSLVLNFGHAFTENVDFLAGPSLVWNRTTNKPVFSLHDWNFDANDQLHLGLRASLRYRF